MKRAVVFWPSVASLAPQSSASVRASNIEKLSDATRVYCVGFAFDKLNCDLLDAGFWGSKCWATNYDGELSVDNNMRSIRVKPERVWRGSSSDPMFVGKAAAKGFFSAP